MRICEDENSLDMSNNNLSKINAHCHCFSMSNISAYVNGMHTT